MGRGRGRGKGNLKKDPKPGGRADRKVMWSTLLMRVWTKITPNRWREWGHGNE